MIIHYYIISTVCAVNMRGHAKLNSLRLSTLIYNELCMQIDCAVILSFAIDNPFSVHIQTNVAYIR